MRDCRFRATLALATAGLAAAWMGCGVLNPDLIGTTATFPAVRMTSPDGYIVLMLVNQSVTSTQATYDLVRNGVTMQETISSGPLNFFAITLSCDSTSVDLQTFGYAGTDGVIEIPANLGVLQVGQDIFCGSVISVEAIGTPPVFSVGVY